MSAHPARTDASGHNPEVTLEGTGPETGPLVTDLSLEELEHEARRVIGEMAYAYYAGGADDERLLAGNVSAWERWQLHPRVLAGVDSVSTAT
ncbi:MAG TPA: alpha-hydroxy-acid oxidizing protein, partial [Acidimicrobiales bacterium]